MMHATLRTIVSGLALACGLSAVALADTDPTPVPTPDPGQGDPTQGPGQGDPTLPTDPADPTDPTDPTLPTVPDGLTLRQFSYAGTGCPAGSITGSLPVEGTTFLIGWQPFVAEVGPGVPLPESRKNCQMLLDFAYPDGWQFAVKSVGYGGTLNVGAGVTATVAAAFYFQGSDGTTRFNQDTAGPLQQDFTVVNDVADDALTWSTCDASASRAINVNVQARVAATTRGAAGSVRFGETSEGLAPTVLSIIWRQCERAPL